MTRKIISASLLLAVMAWAELILAPFLALHARMAAMTHDEHQSAPAPEHPCCPKVHGVPVASPPFAISSAGLPRTDEHRCCFSQGPQSAPAPAVSHNRLSKNLLAVNWATVTPSPGQHDFSDLTASAELRSPPGDLNMVVRI